MSASDTSSRSSEALTTEAPDTGDHVLHEPTGETWVVACVQGGKLSWCGWPEGMVDLKHCRLVKKAEPGEREKLLRSMADSGGSDHRVRYARRVLEAQASSGVGVETQSDNVNVARPNPQEVAASPQGTEPPQSPLTWPPRFKITPRGAAGLFLRRFADASGTDQDELAAVIEHFAHESVSLRTPSDCAQPPTGSEDCA